jgi:NAD(P)-dependent dehydrogenase (short-subunit alcohol dehydrogenase family)
MKNILVIGAGKGIGLSITKLLAESNNVLAVTRSQSEELENTRATVLYGDSSDNSLLDGGNMFEVLDGLVYCPGSINLKPFSRLSTDDFQKDFEQNVLGAVRVIQKCVANLKRSNSASVVLFSTVAVKTGMTFHSSVAASKGAVEGLVRSLAAEYAGSKIRFNAIAPSLIETSLSSSLVNTPEKKDAAAKRHPLQRIGRPEEVAALASFLLSENAGWITGQIIGVDGGLGALK